MGCAHIFNWVVQSTNHQEFALQHFPITAELAMHAQGKADFHDLYEQLTEDEKAQYNGEQKEWFQLYGQPWEDVGCAPETVIGEHSDTAAMEGPSPIPDEPHRADVAAIQKALVARGYRPGNTEGYWDGATCAACYKFKRERLHDYSSHLSWDFFADLGFSEEASYDYEDMFKNACVVFYTEQIEPMMRDVVGIQEALFNHGFNPGSTNGIMDSKTCTALKAFQHAKTGSSSDAISAETFYQLGFDIDYSSILSTRYGGMCALDERIEDLYTNVPQEVRSEELPAAPVQPGVFQTVRAISRPRIPIAPIAVLGFGLLGVAVYLAGAPKKRRN
jgi:hypothetical protein